MTKINRAGIRKLVGTTCSQCNKEILSTNFGPKKSICYDCYITRQTNYIKAMPEDDDSLGRY